MNRKIVTVRMSAGYYPRVEEVCAVMERVKAWEWNGDVAVPVRMEYPILKGKVAHFSFGEVAYDRGDAEALLLTLDGVDAIICAAPRPERERSKRISDRAVDKAAEKPKPVDPSEVRPSLRFLLEADAKQEAGMLADRLDFIPAGHPALRSNADNLDTNFPLLARADEALGGKLREMLRLAGSLPRQSQNPFDKAAYRQVIANIWQGNPHLLTQRQGDGKLVRGTVDAAIAALAELHQRMEAEPKPAEPKPAASRRLRPEVIHPKLSIVEKVARDAERDERDRLDIGWYDPLTPEQQRHIREVRRLAVEKLREIPADCPF